MEELIYSEFLDKWIFPSEYEEFINLENNE